VPDSFNENDLKTDCETKSDSVVFLIKILSNLSNRRPIDMPLVREHGR
jgi:hypothetical protein